MGKISGAEILVRALKTQGVQKLFSLPGAEFLPVYDACLREGIEIISGRHEGAVVQTAEGWSRVAGKPAVAALAVGPGLANGVAGFATAYAECSPVIMLSGTDESGRLGKGARQELPQVQMCAPLAKWSALVTETQRIPEAIATAFEMATGGFPGPVHLSLPADTLEQPVEEQAVTWPQPRWGPPGGGRGAENELIEAALDLLAGARRPVIVAGITAFWSQAGAALQSLVETTGVPLFTVERSRGLVSDDHPYCFGDGSAIVNPAAQMIHYADTVALLGDKIDCRFGWGQVFGKAKVIQVCPDPAEIGRNCPVRLGLAGDARVVTEQLLAAAHQRPWQERTSWLETLRQARREQQAQVMELDASPEAVPHAVHLAGAVEEFLDADSILVFDGGDCSGWARFRLKARRPGGWQASSVLGHLGCGLPYALGAQVASPGSRVVLLTGDGALGFSVMEFETAVRHRLPVVIVVANDAAWGFEEYVQSNWFGPDRLVATKLGNVRWDGMAKAMGGWGEFVDRREDLRPALARAFAAGVPACVNVLTRSTPSPLSQSFLRQFTRRRAQIRLAAQTAPVAIEPVAQAAP
jgi:acetolactate synthase I/II/III large subunit